MSSFSSSLPSLSLCRTRRERGDGKGEIQRNPFFPHKDIKLRRARKGAGAQGRRQRRERAKHERENRGERGLGGKKKEERNIGQQRKRNKEKREGSKLGWLTMLLAWFSLCVSLVRYPLSSSHARIFSIIFPSVALGEYHNECRRHIRQPSFFLLSVFAPFPLESMSWFFSFL